MIHHLPIGVGSLVIRLIEANSEVGPVEHKDFRQLSVAVRNTFNRSLRNVEDIIYSVVLDRECGHVRV